MKKYLLIILPIIFLFMLMYKPNLFKQSEKKTWKVQSIDTMKYSRDPSREKLNDIKFDKVIDQQISAIAHTGATHVAIGTPYDEEFTPIMKRWVASARKYHLKVWFRGNFSGWEEWFAYPKMDRKKHIAQTEQFILNNKDLFEDGDIFTSCPECENGSGVNFGDHAEVVLYRAFLTEEYITAKRAFHTIGKNVTANYYSMNGDVAKIVMDRETTKALDGVVTIDHYVHSSDVLVEDILHYAKNSGGKVMLGEFGAPIPDINGKMTDEEQKKWIQEAFEKLSKLEEVEGINYWVNTGGSTALWRENGSPKSAVQVIKTFYKKK
jgi:hypothetical protein